MAYFDTLNTAQVAALTTAAVNALTSADMASLTTVQAPVLTTAQVVALSTANISGITTSALATLATTQIVVIETADIAALTSSQVGAFTTAQVAGFTTAQLAAIEVPDIAGLNTAQLNAFSTAQVAALNSAGIAKLNLGFSQYTVTGSNDSFSIIPPNPIPTAIPTGVTWSSGVFPFSSFNSAVAAILANKVLTVTVQRYMDSAGTLPVGAAGTLTSTANTAGYTSVLSINVPATYLKVTVANASGTTAIVSNFAIGVSSY